MTFTLELPVPMAQNQVSGNFMSAARQKKAYQRAAWTHAITQSRPDRDPPGHVTLSAHFRLYGPLRDEDGLWLKWVLDTLRQHQTGSLAWRQGVYDQCGYFVDDDPAHLTLGPVTQEIDRKHVGLAVTLEAS